MFARVPDSYSDAPPPPASPLAALLIGLRDLLSRPRWWEKAAPWLEGREALRSTLTFLCSDAPSSRSSSFPPVLLSQKLARCLWLAEELIYDDLLKGTGWGRRRGWFKEKADGAATVAAVAALAAAAGAASRTRAELGLLTRRQWEGVLRASGGPSPPPSVPELGQAVGVSGKGYEEHVSQIKPPAGFEPRPLPPSWLRESGAALLSPPPPPLLPLAIVVEVSFASGVWQRQTWQGRFSSRNAVTELEDARRVCAWVLLRRTTAAAAAGGGGGGGGGAEEAKKEEGAEGGGDGSGEEILWGVFTAEHGFRHAPPGSGAVMALPAPKRKKLDEEGEGDGDGELPAAAEAPPQFWSRSRGFAAVGVHVHGGKEAAPDFLVPLPLLRRSPGGSFPVGTAVRGSCRENEGALGVVVAKGGGEHEGGRGSSSPLDPWRSVRVEWRSGLRGDAGGAASDGAPPLPLPPAEASPWQLVPVPLSELPPPPPPPPPLPPRAPVLGVPVPLLLHARPPPRKRRG